MTVFCTSFTCSHVHLILSGLTWLGSSRTYHQIFAAVENQYLCKRKVYTLTCCLCLSVRIILHSRDIHYFGTRDSVSKHKMCHAEAYKSVTYITCVGDGIIIRHTSFFFFFSDRISYADRREWMYRVTET